METLISIITILLDSYVQFQEKLNQKVYKAMGKYGSVKGGKKSTETATERDLMADLLHKNIKTTVLSMLK